MRNTLDFDAIVIGSGIGGLTAASLLTQVAHKRVLLLERHFRLGGFTQTFRRAGFTFDPGLHYVGDIPTGGQQRRFVDLVTGGRVDWQPMRSPFDSFVYPGLRIDQPSDPADFQKMLVERFPGEAAAIRQYFLDVKRMASWFNLHIFIQLLPRRAQLLARLVPGRKLALQTTAQYLDRHFHSQQLKAVLVSQWGDYGLPPSQSAFGAHALVVQSYLHGGWYPVGGSGEIASQIADIVRSGGGQVLLNHEVSRILIDDGSAQGVRVTEQHGKRISEVTFRAPLVVSDAGAQTTFTRLLPEGFGRAEQRALASLSPGTSMVELYLGLSDNPTRLGLHGENYWIYEGFDHDASYAASGKLIDGRVTGVYASFPSARDPRATRHTAQLITWVDPAGFSTWRDQRWHQRGEEYNALKERISDALLDFVAPHLPGLRELVIFRELATPLSFEHFTGHAGGVVYGLPATPARFRLPSFGPRTSIRGLLLTGADAASLGVVGAMWGGILAAATAMGTLGFPRIASAAAKMQPRLETGIPSHSQGLRSAS